jgi:fructokinase
MADPAASGQTRNLYGGIELGGTKVICVVGAGPGDIKAAERVRTSDPEHTLGWAVRQLKQFEERFGSLAAIGIASFGPIDLRSASPTFGQLLRTPKPKWSNVSVIGPVRQAFHLPIGLASDVEGAALAEGLCGAADDVDIFVYLTVGTGIGAGVIAGGKPVRGLVHPEIGHLAVPRQAGDDFPGSCPFHGDCLEGMASGPAMAMRWNGPAERLEGAIRDAALDLEAGYLAAGLRNIVYSFAPERMVIGGGVGLTPGLVERVRGALGPSLADYPGLSQYSGPGFVTEAKLGDLAGPRGALALAELAYRK